MPRKKPRREDPLRAADPVSPPPTTPAVPAGGRTGRRAAVPLQYERDQTVEPTLTSREEEVVDRVADSQSNLQTAEPFGTSLRTIEKHMKSIRAKLGLDSAPRSWRHKQQIK